MHIAEDTAVSYPYPALLPLLQVLLTPEEYWRAHERHNDAYLEVQHVAAAAYWRIVPSYTYAQCPICQVRYHEPADTYWVGGWDTLRDLSKALYATGRDFPLSPRCSHFLGIQRFLNLHGIKPTEVAYMENRSGEAPYLTPWFFPSDLATYAVLHALPICRVEGEQFVPRYTIFALTYFSEEPKEILRRNYAAQEEDARKDPTYYPGTVGQPGGRLSSLFGDVRYHLQRWVACGQLGWLDITQPDLPLRIGPEQQLPAMYQEIKGNRIPYTWRRR